MAIDNLRLSREIVELEALREMERLRTELIASVSHEMRTPLGIITAGLTTLLRDDITLEAEVQHEFLTDLADEAVRLEKIIDNLLDSSRLQQGRLRLNVQPVDMGHLILETVRTLQPHHDRHTLRYQLPAEALLVQADDRRLEQVLRNLVSNAVKYSPAGGEVFIQATQSKTESCVAVSDQGIGIPPSELEKIFETFYRVDNEHTFRTPGAGLGLAVCQGILEAHGGRIWAESQLGQGSTFYFTLPIAPPHLPA